MHIQARRTEKKRRVAGQQRIEQRPSRTQSRQTQSRKKPPIEIESGRCGGEPATTGGQVTHAGTISACTPRTPLGFLRAIMGTHKQRGAVTVAANPRTAPIPGERRSSVYVHDAWQEQDAATKTASRMLGRSDGAPSPPLLPSLCCTRGTPPPPQAIRHVSPGDALLLGVPTSAMANPRHRYQARNPLSVPLSPVVRATLS